MDTTPAPEQKALLHQARRAKLAQIWVNGSRRLSAEERAEIADIIGTGESDVPAPPSGEPLTLTPAPVVAELTPAQLDELGALYEVKRRQLYRYLTIGATAHDLCPLADPAAFVQWWGRHMKHRVPPALLAAAARQSAATAPPPAAAAAGAPSLPGAAPGEPGKPAGLAFNLGAATLDEGEEVQQARQLLAGVFAKLEAAFTGGLDDQIRMWQPRWEKASSAFAKAKAADDADRKRRGLLVSRADVQADIDEAVDMLKMMRESMDRRIREKLPDVEPALLDRVTAAIREVRAKEDMVFQSLPSLKSSADVLALLTG